jgi:hypothetical protein
MRPYQQLRFWARRAPLTERLTAGIAVAVAVVLVAWLLVPYGDPPTDEVIAADPTLDGDAPGGGPIAPGGRAPGATGTGEPAGGVGLGPGGPDGALAAPGMPGDPGGDADVQTGPDDEQRRDPAADPQGCVAPPGSVRGITDSEVRIAVVLTQVIGPAANELFDIAHPDEQRADFEAVIAGINAEGGVACRPVVAQYYIANPADESQMMRLCRDIADAGHFAVVDTGSLATRPAVLACFGQLRTPYFGGFFISETQRRQSYPYLYSVYTLEHLYKSTAFGLRDIGFFDPANGFEKLGFIYRYCDRQSIHAFRGWIREAGVPDSQVVTYNLGCPPAFASESDLAQAVQQFRGQGVTHVVLARMEGDYQRFTEHAELQGFRPQYGFADTALLSIAEGNRRPNARNMANAIAITLGRNAEEWTPGMSPTPGTQRCNAYRAAAGLPPVWEVPSAAGTACAQLWMLRAAVDNAPELSHAAMPLGLQRAGRMDFSFPQGMADFSAQGTTTGGQYWRVAQFQPDCERRCWRVIQPEFRRGWL